MQRCEGRVIRYFRIYDLHSTCATRLSAGGVADEWVTQLLRQGDAKVFKKYSQMKLQMKREALAKLNRQANEGGLSFGTVGAKDRRKLWKAHRSNRSESMSDLVGAGRFERPTPCAQAIGTRHPRKLVIYRYSMSYLRIVYS